MYNQNDDLKSAISYNSLGADLKEDQLDEIVAKKIGHNDEDSWHWVVRLTDGKFVYLTGGCDYTGWDCQSHLTTGTIVDTAVEAVAQAPSDIQIILTSQLIGENPVGSYEVKNV